MKATVKEVVNAMRWGIGAKRELNDILLCTGIDDDALHQAMLEINQFIDETVLHFFDAVDDEPLDDHNESKNHNIDDENQESEEK